jgi:protein gp37
MNKTKIEWTDLTLNPVVGCTHGCPYCYARKMAKRFKHRCQDCYDFKPHAHLERLEQLKHLKKPRKIFIDSMWDWNCKDNLDTWLFEIGIAMRNNPQHIFQLLSKKPLGYKKWGFSNNVWLGTTVTGIGDVIKISELGQYGGDNILFVSIEPFHRPFAVDYFYGMDWIIVGAETGNRKDKIIPEDWWVEKIIDYCTELDIPLFLKDNLNWPEEIKEFPKYEFLEREGK